MSHQLKIGPHLLFLILFRVGMTLEGDDETEAQQTPPCRELSEPPTELYFSASPLTCLLAVAM